MKKMLKLIKKFRAMDGRLQILYPALAFYFVLLTVALTLFVVQLASGGFRV